MALWSVVAFFARGVLADRASLAAENLALRQQLAVLRHSVKGPGHIFVHGIVFSGPGSQGCARNVEADSCWFSPRR